jgi:hypothetical protein
MTRTVSQRIGVKENSKAYFVNADEEAIENLDLPNLNISKKNLITNLIIYIFS